MICNPYSDCEAVFESPVPPITVNGAHNPSFFARRLIMIAFNCKQTLGYFGKSGVGSLHMVVQREQPPTQSEGHSFKRIQIGGKFFHCCVYIYGPFEDECPAFPIVYLTVDRSTQASSL